MVSLAIGTEELVGCEESDQSLVGDSAPFPTKSPKEDILYLALELLFIIGCHFFKRKKCAGVLPFGCIHIFPFLMLTVVDAHS